MTENKNIKNDIMYVQESALHMYRPVSRLSAEQFTSPIVEGLYCVGHDDNNVFLWNKNIIVENKFGML